MQFQLYLFSTKTGIAATAWRPNYWFWHLVFFACNFYLLFSMQRVLVKMLILNLFLNFCWYVEFVHMDIRHLICNIWRFWIDDLDWWFGLVIWIGDLDWWFGLVIWIGDLDWWFELMIWVDKMELVILGWWFELMIWVDKIELMIWVSRNKIRWF
jgi:hypothetical protein